MEKILSFQTFSAAFLEEKDWDACRLPKFSSQGEEWSQIVPEISIKAIWADQGFQIGR